MQVCKKKFVGVLNISNFRVQRLCRALLISGTIPKETRGGDTKSWHFEGKKIKSQTIY